MRFSNTLKSNQVNEWKENYVSYEALKPLILKNKELFKTRMASDLKNINDFFFLLEKKAVAEKEEIFDDVDVNVKGRMASDDLHALSEHTRGEAGCASDNYETDKEDGPDGLRMGKMQDGGFCGASADDAGNESENEESGGMASSDDRFSYFAGGDRRRRGLERIFRLPRQFEKRKREKNIQEFLHAIISIKRFRELNYTGLVKLSKKYDKVYPSERFHETFVKRVNESYFNRSKRIDNIYRAVKELYRSVFAKDDPNKVKSVFRRLKTRTRTDPVVAYASGVLGGMSAVLICLMDFQQRQKDMEVFFATVLLQYSAFLFGLCVIVFRRFYINYKFIFNFDVCSSLSSGKYLLLVSLLIFVNAAGTWLNLRLLRLNPYWMVLVLLLILLVPFRVFHHNSRFYFLSVFSRITVLPLSLVRFRHFYFADVGQSLTFCFKKILFYGMDLDWRVEGCANSFFSTVRFLQCLRRYRDTRLRFPHIANALKYILSMLVGVAIPLHRQRGTAEFLVYKVMLLVISSCCSCAWDICVDWGIFRDKMMYPRYVYGCGVVFNAACRFSWILTLFSDISMFWLAFVEISRRFVWTIFRIEFEHLNNCSEFKSKGSIWLTSRELFYKKDYEANIKTNDTETENDSSIA